jgi:hypothetical protein
MYSFGFIMTRHVNSEITNRYWNHSVKLLSFLYPNVKIVIIDDNSKQEFVKAYFNYSNIEIIQSEFHGCGEFLPYYYYIKNKFFDNAVIIHDSVFFHKKFNFNKLNGYSILPLWFFNPDKENINNTIRITQNLKNSLNIQKKIENNDNLVSMPHLKWYGCFGLQTYINHNFLLSLESKYFLTNLATKIKNRPDRCCLERIFGCIFFTENPNLYLQKAIFGDIMKYQKWEYSFQNYVHDVKNKSIPRRVIKVWSGR